MTLCIAWKEGNQIHFSSDSRLSVSDTEHADIGIKIMDIPVKIDSAVESETGKQETLYNYRLGLCYCGDTTSVHLIKETVADILQRLQAIPGHTDFSLNGICKTVAKFAENTANSISAGWGGDPSSEFLLGGFCPEKNTIIVYKFEIVDAGAGYVANWKEILSNSGDIEIMGSGTVRAEELIDARRIRAGKNLLKVLRDICNETTVPSVGGRLQYGSFRNNNFEILGVQEYEITDAGGIDFFLALRGTTLYKENLQAEDDDFHIAGTFITPFEDEIDEQFDRTINGGGLV